ncbi:GWxTD domain-containing protein [Fodinibius saliphilus]|uniref:GWxTD domain-containing protein n=1 Tax=Fodinibius saliphilus TaxID=1920650 RepID=UPI00110971F8|nr:GWxTD domain-containing protein [Fodinibius saliphilus]
MKSFNYLLSTALFVLGMLFISDTASAQWNTEYQQLVNTKEKNPISVHIITLPEKSDSTVTLGIVFSMPYSYLHFKKNDHSNNGNDFSTSLEFNVEVFKNTKTHSSSNDEFSIEGLEPIARDFWEDTVYAKNYEQSQSREYFLNRYLKIPLPPGTYDYVLQMKKSTDSQSRISQRQTVHISSFKNGKKGNVILGNKLTKENGDLQLSLSRLGSNVTYGKNFYMLAYIPDYDSTTNYSLEINNLEVSQKDTSQSSTVYSHTLSRDDIKTEVLPTLSKDKEGKTQIRLQNIENSYTYALVKVPNKKFPNGFYRLTISKSGQDKAIVYETYKSIWVDMPKSLLNLNVAIDMLHYIVDDKTLDRLSNGSAKEREQKFHNFWKERDPSPNTDYNELMAEYYRRIDYAYNKFSTQNRAGHKSDRGKVYIKFGPPKDMQRKFPTNGPTTEIWTYPSRKFIFHATTGFGDFKLVSKEKL